MPRSKRPLQSRIILLFVVSLLILGGGYLYNKAMMIRDFVDFSKGDPLIQVQPTQVPTNPFESFLGVEKGLEEEPQDTSPDGSTNHPKEESPTNTEEPSVQQESSPSGSTMPRTSSQSNPGVKDKKPTYQSLVAAYHQRFQALQTKQEGQLFNLIEEGKAEYQNNKSKATSLATMANRYLNRVSTMEKQADQEFSTLIKDFRAELKKHSYDTSIIQEIETYYTSYKKSLRNELYSKAVPHVR